MHGDHDHGRGVGFLLQQGDRSHAIQLGHPQVHEHNVRVEEGHLSHPFVTVAGGVDDLDIVDPGQQGSQSSTHDRVVIHQQHTDGWRSWARDFGPVVYAGGSGLDAPHVQRQLRGHDGAAVRVAFDGESSAQDFGAVAHPVDAATGPGSGVETGPVVVDVQDQAVTDGGCRDPNPIRAAMGDRVVHRLTHDPQDGHLEIAGHRREFGKDSRTRL